MHNLVKVSQAPKTGGCDPKAKSLCVRQAEVTYTPRAFPMPQYSSKRMASVSQVVRIFGERNQ